MASWLNPFNYFKSAAVEPAPATPSTPRTSSPDDCDVPEDMPSCRWPIEDDGSRTPPSSEATADVVAVERAPPIVVGSKEWKVMQHKSATRESHKAAWRALQVDVQRQVKMPVRDFRHAEAIAFASKPRVPAARRI